MHVEFLIWTSIRLVWPTTVSVHRKLGCASVESIKDCLNTSFNECELKLTK